MLSSIISLSKDVPQLIESIKSNAVNFKDVWKVCSDLTGLFPSSTISTFTGIISLCIHIT